MYPFVSISSSSFIKIIWIPVSVANIMLTIICSLYYVKVTENEIIIFFNADSNNKSARTSLRKYNIKIKNIWCVEVLQDRIILSLKDGYFIGFYLHHFLKKEEIKNLFSQVRQQVIEQSKKEEKTN